MQLATAYAILHKLFGCIIWGHHFGIQLHLHGASGIRSNVGKLEALYLDSLQWALATSKITCNASLYLLAATLPLHGLNIKATALCFGGPKQDKRRFDEADDA